MTSSTAGAPPDAPWLPTASQAQLLLALLAADSGRRLRDWAERQADRAPSHDIVPLLPVAYRRLAQDAPDAAITHVSRDAYVASSRSNLLKMSRLLAALRTLGAANVDVVVLKGAALVVRYHQGYGQRPMQDIDLLVRAGDTSRALDVLRAAGWQPEGDVSPAARAWRVRVDHALPLLADSLVALDLHWAIAGGVSPALSDDVLAVAEPVVHQGVTLRVPAPADLLFQLLIHAVQPLLHPSCRWIVDAATVIDGSRSTLDWSRLIDRGARSGMTRRIHAALQALSAMAPGRVPGEVLERLASTRSLARHRRELALYRLMPPHSRFRVVRWHWHLFLRLRDGDPQWRKLPAPVGFLGYLRIKRALGASHRP